MGLTILSGLPRGEGTLIEVRHLPITVVPNEEYEKAKAALANIVQQAGSIVGCIQSDESYGQGIALMTDVRRFRKAVEKGVEGSKRELNDAKNALMDFAHQLDDPAAKIERALSTETAAYQQRKEQARRAEEERLRREAELERRRKQREADLNALKDEIATANAEADAAIDRHQPETAAEIRRALKRFAALESAPDAFQDPIGDAQDVREAVALAKAHEQARIAAEKARLAGNKAKAKQIEAAAAKIEVNVAPVVVEKVEAAPVVVPKEELEKGRGQWVKTRWVLECVSNPNLVPDEFWVIDERLIQAKADRFKEVEPVIPGCVFRKEVKTVGIR